jgi:peptide-methionine (S)-S-oxide reductase
VSSDQQLHRVSGNPLHGPWPSGLELAVLAGGCFWGIEEIFWQLPGVFSTAAGYAGGDADDPTYEAVCSGETGHAEAVLVVFDPQQVTYEELLAVFFEHHDPTQGMRQGNDVGSQYRSAIFATTPEQLALAERAAERYQQTLTEHSLGTITTEIRQIDPERDFHHAEPVHQQYLALNPHGYRCHSVTGIPFPAVTS